MKKMVLKAGVFCVALLLGFSAYAVSGLNGILAVGEGDQQHLLAYGFGRKALLSDDGKNWRAIDIHAASDSHAASLHAGVWKANSPHVVLVGDYGAAPYSTDGGKNFVHSSIGGKGNITGIVFDGTRYIAVSSAGGIATSEDDADWGIQQQRNITGIVFDGTRYIAVSSAGGIATRKDGADWDIQQHLLVAKSKSKSGMDTALTNVDDVDFWGKYSDSDRFQIERVALEGIAAANGVVVIVGHNGFIATSADGENWHMQDSGIREDLYSVASSNSNFMAVGAKGSVLISHNNGSDWRATQPPEGAEKLFARSVFQDGAREGFFVAGSSGYSYYLYHFDPPSQQWQELSLSAKANIKVNGVARAFGRLFVAGWLTGPGIEDRAIILSSADDGATWKIVHGGA